MSVAAGRYVVSLDQAGRTHVADVGGKGANLGELSRLDDVRVPPGYCVTTTAFRRAMGNASSLEVLLDRLAQLGPEDRDGISELSAEIRNAISEVPIPEDLAAAIARPLEQWDADGAYAVRSSATAEDLPTASFAGQQDSYLNVVGPEAIIEHVSMCWASLFTERAVTYRLRNGIDHRKVSMAVVVQKLVAPDAAGILFTADPVTANRTVETVEAVFGLGEALVSGLVSPDVYKVAGGIVVEKAIAPGPGEKAVLTDAQAVQLAELGRRIEAHFACPQDIEWCVVDGDFHIVQSRPITTLFPIPEADGAGNHVYVSVGHQQMMTDPMKPLGLSIWQMTALAPMAEAGGRLFVDVTKALASPEGRNGLLGTLGRSDPLITDALQTIVDRGDFVPLLQEPAPTGPPPGGPPAPLETDPAIVDGLVATMRTSLAAVAGEIQTKSGPDLFPFIREDLEELQRLLRDPQSIPAIMAALESTWWLNEHLEAWLGETNAADTLTQSAPNNVTSEMGLALLDVADAIRPYPEVVAYLRGVHDEHFLDQLPTFEGGQEAHDAIRAYLDEYGMRCIGEIDITRPRWSEQPSTLIPAILGNIETFEPGASRRRFERGEREARHKEQDLLARLRALPDGDRLADETQRTIERLRTFIGYREFPKYAMISRYFIYKQALLKEAETLVDRGVLTGAEDIFYLRFQELHDAVRTQQVDNDLILERKAAYVAHQALTPPRVLTSDGEAINGVYRRDDVPADALVGIPVSTGCVEGRARVIHDLAEADLESGDILVTAYTDPSWSPLFVTING
ncbi:MAG: phosphoenolpyruvate synthase, partial [Actinomycetia bacterium]|nr:phosphoenolpyruvate synthase [Actinomycetes bacterium]